MNDIDISGLVVMPNSHSSDTRVLTITAAIGGQYGFALLETCDVNGNPKSEFTPNEKVYFNVTYVNSGSSADPVIMEIKDEDTGTVISRLGLEPAEPEGNVTEKAIAIGNMPNRTWRLRFTITP